MGEHAHRSDFGGVSPAHAGQRSGADGRELSAPHGEHLGVADQFRVRGRSGRGDSLLHERHLMERGLRVRGEQERDDDGFFWRRARHEQQRRRLRERPSAAGRGRDSSRAGNCRPRACGQAGNADDAGARGQRRCARCTGGTDARLWRDDGSGQGCAHRSQGNSEGRSLRIFHVHRRGPRHDSHGLGQTPAVLQDGCGAAGQLLQVRDRALRRAGHALLPVHKFHREQAGQGAAAGRRGAGVPFHHGRPALRLRRAHGGEIHSHQRVRGTGTRQ